MAFNSSTFPRRIFRSDRRIVFISRYVIHGNVGFTSTVGFHRWRLQSPRITMAGRSSRAVGMGVWVDSVSLSDGHATSASVNGM
ncbi:hypothetical protein V6N12_009636 [Hibiscus sabdariffa]|uniref:Uncharacterized protein n=1 Tax=Hibiscus sabdariffa TaxID=183260 RepID=A0ABR2BUH9_9ROSI